MRCLGACGEAGEPSWLRTCLTRGCLASGAGYFRKPNRLRYGGRDPQGVDEVTWKRSLHRGCSSSEQLPVPSDGGFTGFSSSLS